MWCHSSRWGTQEEGQVWEEVKSWVWGMLSWLCLGVMQIELLSGIWGKICAGDMAWKVTSKEVEVKDLGTD